MTVIRSVLAIVLWLVCGPIVASAAPEAAAPISVTIRAGLISLDSRSATLEQALGEIARVSGAQILVEGTLEDSLRRETVTATFSNVTAEVALRRLLQGINSLFVYSADDLVEVRVYLEGTGQFRPLAGQRLGSRAKQPPPPPTASGAEDADEEAAADAATLAAQALKGATPEQRVQAIERLSDVSDIQLIRRTVSAVLGRRDEHPTVLEAALDLLGQQEEPLVDPVLELLARTRDAETRVRALDYLGEHGKSDPRVRDAVARVANTDRREEVQGNAKALLESLDAQ